MSKFSVTLEDLQRARACFRGYNRLVSALTHQSFDKQRRSYMHCHWRDPVSIEFIIDSNGFADALWALQCLKECDRDIRMYAVWCVQQVQHLITDPRALEALSVAERFANGLATMDQLLDAAWDAWDAVEYRDLNQAAALEAAAHACKPMSYLAADMAAQEAVAAVSWKSRTYDPNDWQEMRARQADMLRRMCQGTAPWQTTTTQELT